MWVYLGMAEGGGLTLPPEALKALGGAGFFTAEQERAGGVVLRPAEAGAPGAVPVSASGALTLPPLALEAMDEWPAWDGIDGVEGWDGRNLEVNIDEEGRCLVLFFAPDSGTKKLRARIAELGWTEEDVAALIDEARTEIYEEKQQAAREAAGAAERKVV